MAAYQDGFSWYHDKKKTAEETEPLVVRRLKEQGFTESQIMDIFEVLDDVCERCGNGEHNCQCWNDE